MQVTVDLPDDVYATALSVAKKESRSLGSVIADLIRGKMHSSTPTPTVPNTEYRFPVVKGARSFTQEEIDQMLEEDSQL